MSNDIRNYEGEWITVLVDGKRIHGRLEETHGDLGLIVVGGWRINMAHVAAWTPECGAGDPADVETDTVLHL